jgi:hypothetical protein
MGSERKPPEANYLIGQRPLPATAAEFQAISPTPCHCLSALLKVVPLASETVVTHKVTPLSLSSACYARNLGWLGT